MTMYCFKWPLGNWPLNSLPLWKYETTYSGLTLNHLYTVKQYTFLFEQESVCLFMYIFVLFLYISKHKDKCPHPTWDNRTWHFSGLLKTIAGFLFSYYSYCLYFSIQDQICYVWLEYAKTNDSINCMFTLWFNLYKHIFCYLFCWLQMKVASFVWNADIFSLWLLCMQ